MDRYATVSTGDGDLRLAYQRFGDHGDPAFLLITGWFSDLTLWPRGFCEALAGRGYAVIRYDNRDSGLSTWTTPEGFDPADPPYAMSDLAADAVGLLDALGITVAHVGGFAFGGTISQLVAIEHPDRVLSVTPLATTSGPSDDRVPEAGQEILALLAEPLPHDSEGLADRHQAVFAAMAGPSFDEAGYRELRRESDARGAPLARGDLQRAVATTAGDRQQRLRGVRAPALVVHAGQDPLISIEAAETQAKAFPNAELLVLDGIGHGVLPPSTWPTLVDAMDLLAQRSNPAS